MADWKERGSLSMFSNCGVVIDDSAVAGWPSQRAFEATREGSTWAEGFRL